MACSVHSASVAADMVQNQLTYKAATLRVLQVLNVAYLVVAVLCTLMGSAGYYMYGTGALDIIPMNLGGVLAKVCAFVILINPVAKFALTMEPVAAAANSAVGSPKGLGRLVVRTMVAVAMLMAARSLPFLAYVMALVSGSRHASTGCCSTGTPCCILHGLHVACTSILTIDLLQQALQTNTYCGLHDAPL